MLVAEGGEAGEPDLEHLPVGHLDDVLDDHDGVPLGLGHAEHGHHGRSGALTGGVGHVVVEQVEHLAEVVLLASAGGGVPLAFG